MISQTQNAAAGKSAMHLALIGPTKNGKTTTIAALAETPDILINCSKGDSNRTKVTISYHFDIDSEPGVTIECVEFFRERFSFVGANPEDRISKFNELMGSADGTLLSLLGFAKLASGTDLNDHIDDVIKSYENTSVDEKLLKVLITTEGIDKYVKRITLRVRPNEALSNVLKEIHTDLFIRDTRGLLDIMVTEDKRIQNIPSLSDLGLDNLDGVIFFASDSIPNIVPTLYADTLKNVLKSVPVFLVTRDKSMVKEYQRIYRDFSEDNIIEFIRKIQNVDNLLYAYDDITTDFFQDTISLFESDNLHIMENGEFCDTFFPLNEVEFLVPMVRELKDRNCDTHSAVQSENFSFFRQVCTQSLCMMLDMINKLFDNIQKLRVSAANQLRNAYEEDKKKETLQNDIARYNLNPTAYMRPQLSYCSAETISEQIIDPLYEPLGPRGGITTMNNGKLRYPATAVLAVTARQYISHLIYNTVINDEIRGLFESVSDIMLAKLLHKTLWCYLYRFTDSYASIRQYLIVNRDEVSAGIMKTRNRGGNSEQYPICDTNDNIVNSFADYIENNEEIKSIELLRGKR